MIGTCNSWNAAAYLLKIAAAVGSNAQTQGVEFDKALGISLIIGATIIVKGGDIGIKQTVSGRLASDNTDIALVQFNPHLAIDRTS